ncbi:transducin beta-like protein 3 isoform X2 [Sinocyclocheilus grahami]|uniref:transducin beta-like protein 3 isoform X2 n=1 Tax=Sinocyclocheilus grahami TaxID=75366 RepID=UPI0007ACA1CE|nr:PREDICTED: transducin beta-like protein 3 isoform X2 [Sinocyclocheilus grahami]
MAGNTLPFKSNYAVSSKIEPFYKGGKVQISHDEQYIFCTCGPRVNILQIDTGKIIHSIEQDDQEDITSFSLSPDDEILVTASRALLLKQWDWKQEKCTRSWRAIHNVPVASMTFDCTSTLLATGGCDGTIKLWDVVKQYCTHNLKGSSGVVHLVEFHPDISRLQLFSSSVDCGIRIWDLRTSKCICVLESHYSAVTSLAFSPDGQTLVSSGRDKICSVWDLKKKAVKRTVPVYEAVEGVVVLPGKSDYSQMGVKGEGLHFVTAGSKGVLRVWDSSSARCVFTQTLPDAPALNTEEGDLDPRSLMHLLPMPQSNRLATVTAEHNILIYQMPALTVQQQFVGYNDDILDVKFLGKDDTHIVVSTNSSQLKVFELATNSCQILYGHTDTILSIDVFRKGSMFASCAKDKSLRLWKMDLKSGHVHCVAQGSGHSNAVGSVACSRLKKGFLVSGSQDCTIKLWDLPDPLPDVGCEPVLMTARLTERAHDKDVNSVTISPNDKLLASGSQDRTAKLWSLADMSLLGVFRGHSRGVWCVQFSPVDQVLATASADGSIKIWSIQEFSCLRDVSEVELAEEQAKQEDQVLKQQELSNLLHEKKYLKALGIAISLDQPHTALRVIREIRQQEDGVQELEKTLLKLRQDQKESVLRFSVVWNTNSRSCLDAQAVLQVLLTHLSPEEILQYQGTRTHLEGLIPYTERHMQRIGRLLQASMFLDYMWQKMRITGGKDSVNLDDDEGMDTSPQSIFIVDKQPMDMADIPGSLQQQEDEEEDLEDSEKREELLDEDESVSTSKSAHVNGMKPNGVNSAVDEGQVSSEESEDEDDVMEMTTKSTDSDPSKTADIR